MALLTKVQLTSVFEKIDSYWNPVIVTELNGQHVRAAKLKGEFVWHSHEQEDELFWIVKGQLKIEFRDRQVILNEGEILTIPRGMEHRPVAEEEVWVILFEPAATVNTGATESELRKDKLTKFE